jgi:hypothetical protein
MMQNLSRLKGQGARRSGQYTVTGFRLQVAGAALLAGKTANVAL